MVHRFHTNHRSLIGTPYLSINNVEKSDIPNPSPRRSIAG